MHQYAFDTELVRLAILLGVVVSMLFYDKYGVTTGGAIVPGYLALFVHRPTQIVATLLVAVVTYWIVQTQLRPRFMLWGRRLYEVEILVALLLQSLWIGVLFLSTPLVPQLTLLYGIGFVLPGIMAHDMGRQGARTTIGAAVICALIVFGLVAITGAFRDIAGLPMSLANRVYHARGDQYAYPIEWLLLGVIVSVLMSMALYRRVLSQSLFGQRPLTDSLRAGGFVTAGYLALVINRPADLAFVLVCSAITYLIVTQFLMRQAILFGRTKMAAMFIVGMMVTWFAEILLFAGGAAYVPWAGFHAISPTIVTLLANDAQRQGPSRTLVGVSVATLGVLAVMLLLGVTYGVFSGNQAIAWLR